MSRFRLLHIINSMDPAAGGPTECIRVMLTSAPGLCDGEVVCLDQPDAPFLRSFPFRIHALGGAGRPLGFNPSLTRWLVANRERYDGFVINGLWRYIGFATRSALLGSKPYFVFPHGMLDPYFKEAFPRKHLAKWPYWLLSEYRVLRDADRVLFTTAEEERLASLSFRLHRWRGAVVPFGASPPPADEDSLRAAFQQACPQLATRRFILFLGRIHRKKGCDLLIRAFLQIAKDDPELDLVVAGPDQQDLQASLQAEVASAGLAHRVYWPGMLHGAVKWGALYSCEVFILPSHQENFGIAVAEALSCGRVVLLSDKVNIAAEIAARGCGLVEPDTKAGTEALLRRWIAITPEARRTMQAEALATFQRHYDLRQTTPAVIELFRSIASGEDVRPGSKTFAGK